jgi:hypothetical protein
MSRTRRVAASLPTMVLRTVLSLATAAGVLGSAAAAKCHHDTPGWANGCVARSHGSCKPSQFPFGNTPGYWNGTGSEAGWTCLMYADNRTGWCKDGMLVQKSAGGTHYNFPEKNCCACGKGKQQPPAPPAPPAPPPPPPPPMVAGGMLCGGACGDHMVLDRTNATVWGVGAKPGAKIGVTLKAPSLRPFHTTAVVGDDGTWAVSLGAQAAGTGHSLGFAGSDGSAAELTDVAFGDVILCSGQSNMEYPLSSIVNGSAVISEGATLHDVRVFRVDHLSTGTPQSTLRWGKLWDGSGDRCTDRCGSPLWSAMSAEVGSFSGVCYLTGRDVYRGLGGKVPIGLVEAAWGGTRIEAWTSPEGLAKCSGEGTAKCGACCTEGIGGWCEEQEPASAPACARMNSSNSGNLCSADYNGMLAPLLPMRFKAMLWYQVRPGKKNSTHHSRGISIALVLLHPPLSVCPVNCNYR